MACIFSTAAKPSIFTQTNLGKGLGEFEMKQVNRVLNRSLIAHQAKFSCVSFLLRVLVNFFAAISKTS